MPQSQPSRMQLLSLQKHPAFGYFDPREENYYERIIEWQNKRNGVKALTKTLLAMKTGVLWLRLCRHTGIYGSVKQCCSMRPPYVGFTGALEKAMAAKSSTSDLVRDEEGIYVWIMKTWIKKLKQYHIHFAVFCSPHNPRRRTIWTREEIEKAMDVYARNNWRCCLR